MELKYWYRIRWAHGIEDKFENVREDELTAKVADMRRQGWVVTKIVLVGFEQVGSQG